MFANTVRAVGDTATLDLFKAIEERRKAVKVMRDQYETKKNTRDTLDAKMMRNLEVTHHIHLLKKLEDKLDVLEQYKPYLEVITGRQTLNAMGKKQKELKSETEKKRKSLDELDAKLAEFRSERRRLMDEERRLKAENRSKIQRFENSESFKIEKRISTTENGIKQVEYYIKAKRKRIKEIEAEIAECENELNSCENEAQIRQRLQGQ